MFYTRTISEASMAGTCINLLCSCLLSILMFTSAADTITANQTISDGQTVVSARGEFEMGFFSYKGSPQNRYFGIWYKKISNGTVIWVANRETAIANNPGIIRVSSRGIVVSSSQNSDNIIWSSNYLRSVKNPVAQLLDTGNLVFRDENDKQKFVWQSFDHPVDNFLPGMKFGYDLVSGIDRYFSPYKSDDDPSPGTYIHRVDRYGYPQLIVWEGSDVLYRTGPWVGDRFSGNTVLKPNGIYTHRFVITRTEVYYISDLLNNSDSAVTRLTVTSGGVARRLIWNKEKHDWMNFLTLQETDCERYRFCGPNGVCNINTTPRCQCMEGFDPKNPEEWEAADWSNGCSRNVELKCGKGDGFKKCSGVKLPDTRWSWFNMSMKPFECEAKCLNNCNCTAYSYTDIRNGGSGCLLWFGDLNDIRGFSEDGQDLYVRMAASELSEIKRTRENKHLQIIIAPVIVILTVMLGLFMLYAYKTRWHNKACAGEVRLQARQDLDLPLFGLVRISNATDNFSNNNKLGNGGFGTVYKGILEEGQEIAVKRLSEDSKQGEDEFMNEVSCIAKLQHRNLVRLLGCCIEEGERLLIYEYLPNKGLDSFIFDKEMRQSLNWQKCYNIIIGMARGLLYLHQDSRLRIIHRDLKVSNILLDYEMNPKISDFGLARIFGDGETQASTTRVVGTHGYMPPEYVKNSNFKECKYLHRGSIPFLFGKLSMLESLDLSVNQLEGEIPQQLSGIYTLGLLNLSHNELSGHIPQGAQFDTFDNDSYVGNLRLCGHPLHQKCEHDIGMQDKEEEDDEDDKDSFFFRGFTWEAVLIGYVYGVVPTFIIGCWMLLAGKPKWFAQFLPRKFYVLFRICISCCCCQL